MATVFVMIFTKVKETNFDAKAFDTRKTKLDFFCNFEENLASYTFLWKNLVACHPIYYLHN